MRKRLFVGGSSLPPSRRNHRRKPLRYRVARFEWLEPRQVLSVPFLAEIATPATLFAGAPLNIPLNANESGLTFTVTSSNPALVTQVLDPLDNPSLKITVDDAADNIHGDMIFQLFKELAPKTTARIIELAQVGGENVQSFYDGLLFHRVAKNGDGTPFVIQGGDPTGDGSGGSGVQFDDEFTPELQFTSAGILAMANSGDDTNDSQFFVTGEPTRWLDFNHSIFGFLTKGYDILHKIEAVPTDSSDKPLHDVVMSNVQVLPDLENRVLRLIAPPGTTGVADVTVTVSDGDPANDFTRTFHVDILADTTNNNPFLGTIAPIETTAGTPVSFTIPATDVDGDAIYYGGAADPSIAKVTINVNSGTGLATVTPTNGFAGVTSVLLGVRAPGGSTWDTQQVPVYVKPAAPTVDLLAGSDTGSSSTDRITNLNNTQGKTLRFIVSPTVSGADVVLYADDVGIGRATASGDSVTIETSGSIALTDGTHPITAQQILRSQAVNVGNLHTSVDLAGAPSAAVSITVDTAAPQITSSAVLTASEGQPYSYDVQTDEEAGGGVTYQLTASPAGMTINAQTGVIGWTPGSSQGPSQQVAVRAADLAGNATSQAFQVQVEMVNTPPTADAQTLTIKADTPRAISLTGSDGDAEVVQTLTFAIVQGPGHGTLDGFDVASGAVTYTANPDYLGPDSFTFTVTDDDKAGSPPSLTSGPATVSINVVSVNHPPVADPQSVSLNEDTPKSLILTGDDGESQIEQTLKFAVVDKPLHGTLGNFNENTGTATYVPDANYHGTDFFTFKVIDDDKAGDPPSLASSPATVSLTINRVNDAPTASAQSVAVLQDAPRAITLEGDDGDPEVNQALTFAIVTPPSHGTLSGFDAATGAVTYTPAADYSGPDSFTFTVTDDASAGDPASQTSAPAAVSINVAAVNAPPVANPQSVTTEEDTPIPLSLAGDDGDPEVVQALRFAIARGPSHGTLVGFDPATGQVTYRPGPDFNGSDSFTFTATDDATAGSPASLTSPPATVAIQVAPVDDAPRFAPVSPRLAFQGQLLAIPFRATDPDVPPQTVRYSLEPGAPQGATVNLQTGDLSWDVPPEFPAGAVRLAVRATEFSAQGQPGLSSVQAVDVTVLDGRVLAAVVELGIPSQASSGTAGAGQLAGFPGAGSAQDTEALLGILAGQSAALSAQASNLALAAGALPVASPGGSLLNPASLFAGELDPTSGLGGSGMASQQTDKGSAAKGAQPTPGAVQGAAPAGGATKPTKGPSKSPATDPPSRPGAGPSSNPADRGKNSEARDSVAGRPAPLPGELDGSSLEPANPSPQGVAPSSDRVAGPAHPEANDAAIEALADEQFELALSFGS